MFVPSNGSAHSFNIIINKTLQARKKKPKNPKLLELFCPYLETDEVQRTWTNEHH